MCEKSISENESDFVVVLKNILRIDKIDSNFKECCEKALNIILRK